MSEKIPEALKILDDQIDIWVMEGCPGLADDLRKARAAFAAEHEALMHCLAIFNSLADRGRYPNELMPDEMRNDGEKLFMGRQGWEFVTQAIAAVDKLS
jgi:hypothetical protein